MSLRINQEEKFADDAKFKMSTHYETGSLKNAVSSTSQSSSILFDSPQDGSGDRNEGKCRSEINLSIPLKQATYRRQTGDIGGLKDEASDSALLLGGQCSRSNGENSFENENVFQMEDELQSRVQVEVVPTQHFENKEENPSRRLDDDGHYSRNAVETGASNVALQPEIVLQPLSLRAEPSKYRSSSREELEANPTSTGRFTKPTGTRKHSSSIVEHSKAEFGTDPPLSVRFIKPTGFRQHSSPTPEHGRENRDIFETGGEQSRNLPAGASFTGGEEIEQLSPGESPEPQIVISPSCSDESHVNWLKLAKAFFWRWFGFVKKKICRQFGKAPLFYLFSTLMIVICINVWDRATTDQDIPLAIIFAFVTFIAITLTFDRGQFSHIVGQWNSCDQECRRGCGNADPCIPWCCCQSPDPRLERHSQYRHLEEDGAFEHEIADVSNLDPKDCPQMKMVEQRESAHAESPDYPEVSQVNADIHVGKPDVKKLGAARKHLGRATAQTTKPHKTRSDRPRSRPTKIFRADIHAQDLTMNELSPPELSPIQETALEDGMQNGEKQPANNDEAGTSTMGTGTTSKNVEDSSTGQNLGNNGSSKMSTNSRFPGGVFKKFSDCSPTLSRSANICQPETPSDYFPAGGRLSNSSEDESFSVDVAEVPEAEEFFCEHYGQSVACSCPTLSKKSVKNRKR